jgi:hypothetical protein
VITQGNRINTMEQLQPEPLVDMMSEELNELCNGLRYYADKVDNLINPTWANPYLLLNKMGELVELVDDHELSGAWFSTHARVNNVVVMVTTPEIQQVSPRCFIVLDLTI